MRTCLCSKRVHAWSEHSSSGDLTSCIWSATTAMNGGTNQENKPRDDELGISPPLFDDTPIDLSSQTLTSCSWSHLSNNNIAAEKSLANTSDFMINRSALPKEDPFISFTSCSSFVSSTPKKASEKTGLRKMEVSEFLLHQTTKEKETRVTVKVNQHSSVSGSSHSRTRASRPSTCRYHSNVIIQHLVVYSRHRIEWL